MTFFYSWKIQFLGGVWAQSLSRKHKNFNKSNVVNHNLKMYFMKRISIDKQKLKGGILFLTLIVTRIHSIYFIKIDQTYIWSGFNGLTNIKCKKVL